MTAANHFLDAQGQTTSADRMPRELGLGSIVRMFTRLVAAVLIIAAAGIWVAPNTSSLPELFMMKLCASFFFALLGVHLLFAARNL
ncbi:MAG: hypothetical protein EP318_10345 [Rhodobacteraceae bacterium]|nr:MAG: hypothetical protein EP318_10345 [Paracoccaceae bacterium]